MDTCVDACCPNASDSLIEAALKILRAADPWKKAEYTYAAVDLWRSGQIKQVASDHCSHLNAPERPARADDKVKLVPPQLAPRLGKGGSPQSRIAILHSLVHIENWAVDLSWDVIARFGAHPEYAGALPRAFFDDFVTVAEDECRHFSLLCRRLEALGSSYGALPAHDGLWESASRTSHSLPARLAVEHCVHEARGLDVLPATVAKFRSNGDAETAALLWDVVYGEEVSHCAAGVRWLTHLYTHAQRLVDAAAAAAGSAASTSASHAADETTILSSAGSADWPLGEDQAACSSGNGHDANASSAANGASDVPQWAREAVSYPSVEIWFHALTRAHFKGLLKPPFNEEARARAGFGPEWYLPLAAVPNTAANGTGEQGTAETAAVAASDARVAEGAGGVARAAQALQRLQVTQAVA